MNRTLHQHLSFLEESAQRLRDQLTDPTLTVTEIERIKLDLHIAEIALLHYRSAFLLEQTIS